MSRSRRPPAASDWRAIASLGEQLVGADSLLDQRDRIKRMTSRTLDGRVDVWLQERLFRLPGHGSRKAFPAQPRSEAMREAISRGGLYVQQDSGSRRGYKSTMAIPIEDQGMLLGAIQVTRRNSPFRAEEIETLQAIESVVAVGLYASYRVEVERFRLEELGLVRRVSAEIANVLHLDELSRRVCDLIQEAFQYYYVAIFTLKPGEKKLRFRSSSSKLRRAGRKPPLALDVELGQGLIGEAAATGQVVKAEDVTRDARYRFIEPLPATRSEVVIPLKLEDRVLGVLDVQSERPGAFHPNDVQLLESLADNISRAVEGARLYGGLERRADQFALVAEVSRQVSSTLELGDMLRQTADLIHDRFGFQHVGLFTVHPVRRLVEYEGGSGERSDALRGHAIPLDEPHGMIPWAAREGKTVLSNDVNKDPRYRPSPFPPRNTRSELTIPLVFGRQVLGVLDIQSAKANAFTDDDRLMFEAVAGTIAAAIRNADLYRSEQWRRQVADSLREVAGLISEHAGTDAVLQAVLTELQKNLPVESAVIWLVRDEQLYPAAVHGLGGSASRRLEDQSNEARSFLKGLLGAGAPVIREPGEGAWSIVKAPGHATEYSALAAPLRVGEQSVGLITIAHSERGRYGHEAKGMVATFASYAAVAIENARLYDGAQEQAYASAALLQVAEAVAGPLGIQETLDTILRIMPILLGMRRVALYTWDSEKRLYGCRAKYGGPNFPGAKPWPAEVADGQFPLADEARRLGRATFHVLRTRQTGGNWARLSRARSDGDALREPTPLLVAVPVIVKGDLLAVLMAEEGDIPARYRPRRLEIIQGIAQQIGMALQNDLLQGQMVARERLETEAQLARQIQKTFVPEELPKVPGWELAARWETARQVGGDFYDVVRTPRGQLGLFVADVSDKGMPAALIMALTRTLFRAAMAEGDSPAQVLATVNDLLVPDTRQGMFVTACYAVLDPATGVLIYANAGHNPPIWIRPGEPARKLFRTAIALGIMEGIDVQERRIALVKGDSLLLYTDGVTEAVAMNGEIYGEDRLVNLVQEAPTAAAESRLSGIQADLGRFTGEAPPSDDLTMVAVRRP